jgi:pyrroloquinoline quinone biosynthesis protein B
MSCTSVTVETESSGEIIASTTNQDEISHEDLVVSTPSLIILGTIQDAGSPHIACHKSCCESYYDQPDPLRMVVSLGFIDPINQEKYLFEASPDITKQLALLSKHEDFSDTDIPNGVFLTHAHIGHYTGLMYFGKEATNTNEVPVFAMPRMQEFLSSNGPWDQLVSENNIELKALQNETKRVVNSNLSIVPFTVPHRDEYSETVGYKIIGPTKTVLFIPDIDKWEKWEKDILKEIESVDFALLDATFYDENELPNREISEIPHPLVSESMNHFSSLSDENKDKVYFIHFNHTNPILDGASGTVEALEKAGYHQACLNQVFEL